MHKHEVDSRDMCINSELDRKESLSLAESLHVCSHQQHNPFQRLENVEKV